MNEPTANPYPVGTLCLIVNDPDSSFTVDEAGRTCRILGHYRKARGMTRDGEAWVGWLYPVLIEGVPCEPEGLQWGIEHRYLRRLVDPKVADDLRQEAIERLPGRLEISSC